MTESLAAAPAAIPGAPKVYNVRMGEMAVATEAGESLTAIGLGSCVGLALIDAEHSVAGLAHVVLPDSQMALGHMLPPAKFADTAVFALVTEMIQAGAHRSDLKAAIVGGAMMFGMNSKSSAGRVGPRNVEAMSEWLSRFSIEVVAQDVGGELGRTIQVFAEDGRIIARLSGGESTDLFVPSKAPVGLTAVRA